MILILLFMLMGLTINKLLSRAAERFLKKRPAEFCGSFLVCVCIMISIDANQDEVERLGRQDVDVNGFGSRRFRQWCGLRDIGDCRI